MERNVNFPVAGISELSVRLGWAQLEIYADDIEQIQVIASGDADTVGDLRIEQADGELVIEQPQYGITLNLTHGHWMQLCVRVPKTWDSTIRANTVSGLVVARGLGGDAMELDTISGDIKASRITAGKLALKTTAGNIRGEQLTADWITCRSVSGEITLDDITARSYRFTSVSGDTRLKLRAGFEQMELRTVSGDFAILTDVKATRISMRTVSGHKILEGVEQTETEGAPAIRVTGVSGNLKIIGLR
jgi:DUF4097 and DUF4098 domain-containing protein YvlB